MVPALSTCRPLRVRAALRFAQDRCRASYPVYEEKRPAIGRLLAVAGTLRAPDG